MRQLINNRDGLTLSELLIAIPIIALIAAAFVPLFVLSAKSNVRSETVLDSTYVGRDAMEFIYGLSKEVQYEQLADELVSLGYDKLPDNEFGLEYDDNKYLVLKFIEEDDLIRAIVRVYNNPDRNRVEVQYESLFTWLGRGILEE